jgi:hypothetical protein
MSDRAREFLEQWFSGHVEAMPRVQRLAEAVRLATKCRKDSAYAGIPLQEIRSAAGYDLIRNILAALDAAACVKEDAESSEFKSLVE